MMTSYSRYIKPNYINFKAVPQLLGGRYKRSHTELVRYILTMNKQHYDFHAYMYRDMSKVYTTRSQPKANEHTTKCRISFLLITIIKQVQFSRFLLMPFT